jgi:hypothetical protein
MGFAYALVCPTSMEVKYVGQTIQTLSTRLSQHIHDSKNKSRGNYHLHSKNWIRSILKLGKTPLIIELTQLTDDTQLNECERYWISYFKGTGCKLTNIQVGGKLACYKLKLKRYNLSNYHRGAAHHQRAKTHCPQGHIYDENNTYNFRGKRYCRACKRERQRAYRRKKQKE